MQLIMHCPETKEDQRELARKMAVLHAGAVIDYINALTCTCEEKLALLEYMKKNSGPPQDTFGAAVRE